MKFGLLFFFFGLVVIGDVASGFYFSYMNINNGPLLTFRNVHLTRRIEAHGYLSHENLH